MTLDERREQVRIIAGPEQANLPIVVIPNDAPAYAHSGAWGIYNLNSCYWRNFRSTQAEAIALRDHYLSEYTTCDRCGRPLESSDDPTHCNRCRGYKL